MISSSSPECHGLDTTYFAALLHRVQTSNATQLCATEHQHTGCMCPNPLNPTSKSKGWQDTMQMNIDLLKTNYTTRGFHPEVVIYGDSITEHLLGREMGHDRFPDIAQVTQETLTKRGGGHINGVPLGIAGDVVSLFSSYGTIYANWICRMDSLIQTPLWAVLDWKFTLSPPKWGNAGRATPQRVVDTDWDQ